jgi:ribosomal protein S18 acetylase RimI-like enzyme
MSFLFCTATKVDELAQILKLQQAYHVSSLSVDDANRDGFVTVMHSMDLLKKMNLAAAQVIAKDGEKVIGYALVMLKSFSDMIPVLQPMFNRLSTVNYGGKKVTDYSFYIMGQICVAENYRGKGVFDSLYQKHKELYSSSYDLCVTSVSTRNKRSMSAHERVGFETVLTFRDETDEWNILVWNLKD